ncbi:Inter-Alpha-Trypsin Inhibitor Heavy Chain H4 [Manis pentadactyla]|nr:Inter-Alpha-Trypsin Inhibitor Heavy Chain H4 [Manis pentadactyla]
MMHRPVTEAYVLLLSAPEPVTLSLLFWWTRQNLTQIEIFEAAGVSCISFSVDKTGYEIKSLFYDVFHNKTPVVTAVDRKSSRGALTCILRKLENGGFKLASLKLLWNAAAVVQDEEGGW